jgi:hypothetical protein
VVVDVARGSAVRDPTATSYRRNVPSPIVGCSQPSVSDPLVPSSFTSNSRGDSAGFHFSSTRFDFTAGPGPTLFTALIVKAYAVFDFRPGMTADRVVPLTVVDPPVQLSRYDVMVAPCAAAAPQVTTASLSTNRADTLSGAPGRPAFTVGFGGVVRRGRVVFGGFAFGFGGVVLVLPGVGRSSGRSGGVVFLAGGRVSGRRVFGGLGGVDLGGFGGVLFGGVVVRGFVGGVTVGLSVGFGVVLGPCFSPGPTSTDSVRPSRSTTTTRSPIPFSTYTRESSPRNRFDSGFSRPATGRCGILVSSTLRPSRSSVIRLPFFRSSSASPSPDDATLS